MHGNIFDPGSVLHCVERKFPIYQPVRRENGHLTQELNDD